MDYKAQIKEYIIDELLEDEDTEINDDTSLFKDKVLDSINLSELIIHIETTYKLKVGASDVIFENFDTLNNLNEYINKKNG